MKKFPENFGLCCMTIMLHKLTLQGSDVRLPEFRLLAGGLIATNHFQMAFKHFDRFTVACFDTRNLYSFKFTKVRCQISRSLQ